ncbi:MAG: hypothetical protein AAFV29_11040, partial [Myxococcota bacterium]
MTTLVAASISLHAAHAQTHLPIEGSLTIQSSMASQHPPVRAVDGRIDRYSCAATERQDQPFWSVALVPNTTVERVTLYTQAGECAAGVHPYRDVCNPGVFQNKRWHCAANPNLPVGNSCSSHWEECVPGCNPGRFDGQWWSCPEYPTVHTGNSCQTGWRVCAPNACNRRLEGARVYVGDYVPSDRRQNVAELSGIISESRSPPQLIAADDDPIYDYLRSTPVEGAQPLTACGGPLYPSADDAVVSVACPPHTKGDFIYVVQPNDDAVLSICEAQVRGAQETPFRPAARIEPFSVIIGSDTQYYWGRNDVVGDDAEARGESQTGLGRQTNREHAAAMNQLLQGPAIVGFSVPEMVILNGDLTEFGRSPQWGELYRDYAFGRSNAFNVPDGVYGIAPIVYPGLGNHDYENNVHDCRGQPAELTFLGLRCGFSFGFSEACRRLDDPTNFCAKESVRHIDSWLKANRASLVSVDDGGSRAYAWVKNNVRFIQMHNYPDYEQSSLGVYSSTRWLRQQMHRAAFEGQRVVLNFHDLNSSDAFHSALSGFEYLVIAIFTGHLHERAGRLNP